MASLELLPSAATHFVTADGFRKDCHGHGSWRGEADNRLAVTDDPADYDDVIVTVAYPWGDIEAPLAAWIQVGPGSRSLLTISEGAAARPAAIAVGPPADEPRPTAWPD